MTAQELAIARNLVARARLGLGAPKPPAKQKPKVKPAPRPVFLPPTLAAQAPPSHVLRKQRPAVIPRKAATCVYCGARTRAAHVLACRDHYRVFLSDPKYVGGMEVAA